MLCLFHEIAVKLDCCKDFNVEKCKCSFFLSFLDIRLLVKKKKKNLLLFFNRLGTITNVCSFTCMLNVC